MILDGVSAFMKTQENRDYYALGVNGQLLVFLLENNF